MNIITRNLQAAIFPHASISERNLKRVLSLFEKVILFQPWFMEKAPLMARDSPHLVQVLNPPERLKPGENFRSLLAEYRQWIRGNKGMGLPAFLALGRERVQNPPVYEIRGMIRSTGTPVEEDEKAEALQWHLTLHLAEELEEERESAETLLKTAAGLDSPLKGALEEDAPGLLGDVSGLERETFFTEERSAQILDAWVSLYGEKVPDRVPLVTTEPQVLEYLKETWKELAVESQGSGLPEVTFLSPDLSTLGGDSFAERRETVLAGTGLGQAVIEFCRNPGAGFSSLKRQAGEPGRPTGGLQWTFFYLPPTGKERFPRKYQFMKGLSGRILGLVQEAAPHER